MRNITHILLCLMVLMSQTTAIAQTQPSAPTNLRVVGEQFDHVINHTPTFGWTFSGANSSDGQTAYRCQVENTIGDIVWDSGKVVASATTAVFGGSPSSLLDGQSYTLRVRVWNQTDQVSPPAELIFRMNTPPPAPSGPVPEQGTTVRVSSDGLSVQWSQPVDAEGDELSATLYGDLNMGVPVTSRGTASGTSGSLSGLSSDGTYVWRVVVSDGYEETAGPVWTFQVSRKGAISSAKSIPFQVDTRLTPGAPTLTLVDEQNVNHVVNHQPEIGWTFKGVDGNDRQTAYQFRILAGTTPIWDSRKTGSGEAKAVFQGAQTLLQDGRAYTAQVRVWNLTDKESAWGELKFRMNTAPPMPTNPRPVDDVVLKTDKQSEVAEWDLNADADGDPLTIRLLGDLNVDDPQTEQIVLDGNRSGVLSGLSRDGVYSWRVVVSDDFEEIVSPVWSFSVRGSAPVAHIKTVWVNQKAQDEDAEAVYAQLGTDQLTFSGTGTVRGNPGKTIVSHSWILRPAESTDATERVLSQASVFEVAALEIGSGTFHLIYNVTDSEGNIGRPDTLTVNVRPDVGQAIIVAGGGYLGENWEAFFNYTASVTNNTYNLLVNRRRYSQEAITFLSPVPWHLVPFYKDAIQVIDTDVSPERLKRAIEDAADRNVKQKIPLLIFLAGHGGERVFFLGDRLELKAEEFSDWLDALNERKRKERDPSDPILQGEVVVVVDFCFSRTFLELISGPGRVVIGSSSDKIASVIRGRSFGSFFFDGVSKGWDTFRSFESARDRIKTLFDQEPYIDADGDQIPIYDVSGKRNPGTERDEQIARSIFIGGDFTNLSRLNPEIDKPSLQAQSDGTYILTAMADKELSLYFTAVPRIFDPNTFIDLPTQDMIVQISVQSGNKRLFQATWRPQGQGNFMLVVQGVDNLKNIAAHRTISVQIGGEAKLPSADFDGNGTVDFVDFLEFAGGFGKKSGDENWDARLDLDRNGEIGFGDFLIFANAFGKKLALTKSTVE